ncbi:MAG TPA: amino acid permease [Bacteroidia bacterium]|jgi:APA family basic amino acid/polyamine antiporter|nr:amino acid permease [Bacteroidia bacterium]
MTEVNSSNTRDFKRTLGLVDATSLVAGSMIGSGIFLVSSDMARDVGCAGWLIVAWLLTGVITLIAALSYGELAGMMPTAGGQYVYIQRAFGKFTSFLYGWTVFAVIQTGVIAAVAMAFANYTSEFVASFDPKHNAPDYIAVFSPKNILFHIGSFAINAQQVLAVTLIVFLTFINTLGVKGGAGVQKVFTSAKLLALFGLIIFGLFVGLKTNVFGNNFTNSFSATQTYQAVKDGPWLTRPLSGVLLLAVFGMTLMNSLFSSDAWNNVTFIAGEIKEPQKNIPKSLFLGTLIVTVLYISANLAYLALLPLKGSPLGADVASRGMQFAEMGRVGTAAATVIFGNVATVMMALLIMVSTFGCNNGIILAGARLYYAMAKDDLFFKRAERLNKFSVPAFALWIQCIWASLLCFSGTYHDLVIYCTFASMLFYIVTISGLFVLRKKEPLAERPYKAFGYPLFPALYILIAIAICVNLLFMDTYNSIAGLIIVAIGVPIYFVQKMVRK